MTMAMYTQFERVSDLLATTPSEVERAAKLLREVAVGKKIVDVEAVEDTIIFSGISHEEFSAELRGRTVRDAQRYGKVFYLLLDGKGRHPVMHFGMTGMLQVKGQLATYYRETPRKASTDWPPRFMKFILHLRSDGDAEETQVAFLDARRLGRVRLCKSPLTEPPISTLGFDPILSMPDLDDFKKGVRKRSCPIKALLLDQSFSAGVGNWVADEILYHARVHPEERCNVLTDAQLEALHTQTSEVCKLAVSVNADDSKFPQDWLFKHRWGKGKKEKHTLTLPDGKPATIKWITVGGRTSAYVAELQKLQRGKATDAQSADDDRDESDLTPLSGDEDAGVEVKVQKVTRKLKRKVRQSHHKARFCHIRQPHHALRQLKTDEDAPKRTARRKTTTATRRTRAS
ncbi:AtMMH-1 [Cubamyces sp. BRFM 1775]|nr:AtMMH-1 [Cubamyces sp. BRFM 1775]